MANAEQFHNLNISMIGPEASLKKAHMLRDFYGDEGWNLFVAIHKGMHPDGPTGDIDEYFFREVQRRFDLPENVGLLEFYKQQLDTANGTMTYLIDTVFPPGFDDVLGLRSEAKSAPRTPSDRLMKLAMRNSDLDPTVKFEIDRQLFLAYISGRINSRTIQYGLDDSLAAIQGLLDDALFEKPIGKTEPYLLISAHDPRTNEVIGIDSRDYKLELTSEASPFHVKQHHLKVRTIPGFGAVLTDPRTKDDRVAVIKALAKAITNGNGGTIKPRHDVYDSIGIKFVVMAGDDKRDELMEGVKGILINGLGLTKDDIVPDDIPSNNRGASKRLRMKRLQVTLPGQPVPLELMFYTLRSYLDYKFDVGSIDESTGTYDGSAHDLYQIKRASIIVPCLFPPSVYQREYELIDINGAIRDKMGSKAQELLANPGIKQKMAA